MRSGMISHPIGTKLIICPLCFICHKQITEYEFIALSFNDNEFMDVCNKCLEIPVTIQHPGNFMNVKIDAKPFESKLIILGGRKLMLDNNQIEYENIVIDLEQLKIKLKNGSTIHLLFDRYSFGSDTLKKMDK